MSDEGGEKTESASDKRRQEFREKGDIAKSPDFLSLLVLSAGFAYFTFWGSNLYEGLAAFQFEFLGQPFTGDLSVPVVMGIGQQVVGKMAALLAPLAGAVVVVAIGGNIAQMGVMLSMKPLEPDLTRLNVFDKFFSTFFNKKAIGTLVSSVAKISVVATVVYMTIGGDGREIQVISSLPLVDGIVFLIERCLSVLFNVCMVLILIALLDYLWQRHVMEEKMKMSKQEVKDESKEVEGNPLAKQNQRKRAMELVNSRMMQAVPNADVIVNNPTHISVALRYQEGDATPIVVAKGADLVAMRIRNIATANGIPMVENKPLARSLYRTVKVGRPVPSEFFRAVAEVLAYVYRLRGRLPKPTAQPKRSDDR